ncbi:uncharacterized protein ColSpa_01340 [Colletotrichum spaethianum]|uniref:Uncharacterized protein n=1 Tax=Colletotrichum spaethianum TaxID=700344 RepID=A0AA37L709_9PEZI|nr:uncharacterized protein ColSpa_01340 [Colletotrichum spaethianum]GKT41159.1 hypothetical protein ColSpa_01340 [Colletotrichum spaethianum]
MSDSTRITAVMGDGPPSASTQVPKNIADEINAALAADDVRPLLARDNLCMLTFCPQDHGRWLVVELRECTRLKI